MCLHLIQTHISTVKDNQYLKETEAIILPTQINYFILIVPEQACWK